MAKILEKGVNPILPKTKKNEKEKTKINWEKDLRKEGGGTMCRTQLKILSTTPINLQQNYSHGV